MDLDITRAMNKIKPGSKIIVALSGGPDSICLLHQLLKYRATMSLDIECAHLHHGLRAEADQDLAFVEELCEDLSLTLHKRYEDVELFSKEHGYTTEEGGRILRYRFFYELANKEDYIALGHHKDDQAETVLLRLMRGTGIHGLGGMRILEGSLFRPLLDYTKEEIITYLDENNYRYVIDHTNLEPIYARNKVRLELLPLMKKYNPRIEEAITSLADQAQETEDYMDEVVDKIIKDIVIKEDDEYIMDVSSVKALHPAVQSRFFHTLLSEYLGSGQNITTDHIEQMQNLLTLSSGSEVHLYQGVVFRKSYEQLILGFQKTGVNLEPMKLELGNNYWGKYKIVLSIENKINELDSKIAYFPVDVVEDLIVRSRSPGDKVLLFNKKGHKKLKDLFIDEKIDRLKRDEIGILEKDGYILWIMGIYRSGHKLVNGDINKVLKVKIEEIK